MATRKKAPSAPTFTDPPAVNDQGMRQRSGRTSVRVSVLTLATLKRVQEKISQAPTGGWHYYRTTDLDECIYRMCKAALGETTEEAAP